MVRNVTILEGIVKEGFRHASGIGKDGTEYPGAKGIVGTIRSQRLFFEEVIPNFSRFYNGTINFDISPKTFKINRPDYEITCN